MALAAAPAPAGAATLTVTTELDAIVVDGSCSLREALIAANGDVAVDSCGSGAGADRIVLPAGFFPLELDGVPNELQSDDLDLLADVEIVGAGPGETFLESDGVFRLIEVHPGVVAALRSLFLGSGEEFNVAGARGGGVFNAGTLLLEDVDVVENRATSGSVLGTAFGGGIFNALGASLTLRRTRVLANQVTAENDDLGAGAGLYNLGTLRIESSTVAQNVGLGGITTGGNGEGGGIWNGGVLVVDRSTVSGNSIAGSVNGELQGRAEGGTGAGGALFNAAGAIATLVNSTLSGNVAAGFDSGTGELGGGGLFLQAGSTATLLHVTLTGNTVTILTPIGQHVAGTELGHGLFNDGALVLTNTLVANDCAGNSATSGGGNLESPGDTCGLGLGPLDQTDIDPAVLLLGGLQDNGGPTETHALEAGSVAIDTALLGPCPGIDQRDVPRPQDGNGDTLELCDIGAYEVPAPAATGMITLVLDAVPDDGQDFTFLGNALGDFALDDDADPTLPASATFSNLVPGSYSVTELIPPGWRLSAITCSDPDGGTTVDVAAGLARLDLDDGEALLCTFVNQRQFTLTTLKAGPGDGTLSGPGIDCGSDCSETFDAGTVVTVGARPAAGSLFAGWSGCDSTSGNLCTVTLHADRTVVATFELVPPPQFTLTAVKAGDGDGILTGPGIDCGSDCSQVFAAGTTVTVAAVPDLMSIFLGWSGCDSINANLCTVTLRSDRTLVATFEPNGDEVEVDLAVTLSDAPDPLPASTLLLYTLEIRNLGPAGSTGSSVMTVLPAGVHLAAAPDGCSPIAGALSCPLEAIPAGETFAMSFSVQVDLELDGTVLPLTVQVDGNEIDPQPANNLASTTTLLDFSPPTVTLVGSAADTGDGVLAECETARVGVVELRVTFDEPVRDPPGDLADDDVTNPANHLLVASGPDQRFATTACDSGVQGDDVAISVDHVTYDAASRTARLAVNAGHHLPDALYRLWSCGSTSIHDMAGNHLDGDDNGVGGDDFRRTFRVDQFNLFENGHFDCDIAGWTLLGNEHDEIQHSSEEVDDSDVSGSVQVANPNATDLLALAQCVDVAPSTTYDLQGRLRLDIPSDLALNAQRLCELFPEPDCLGQRLFLHVTTVAIGDTSNDWILLASRPFTLPGTRSALCTFRLHTADGIAFDAYFDRLYFAEEGKIFRNDFESGDVAPWSADVDP